MNSLGSSDLHPPDFEERGQAITVTALMADGLNVLTIAISAAIGVNLGAVSCTHHNATMGKSMLKLAARKVGAMQGGLTFGA